MEDIETLRIRLHETHRALDVLKATAAYPAAYVKIYEAFEALRQKVPRFVHRLTAERRDIELAKFQIQAEAYLELVSDRKTQDAFILVLDGLAREAWQKFSGMPMEHCTTPEALTPFRDAVVHWTAKGYKRLIASEVAETARPRRGYRAEIDNWMARTDGAETVPKAAKLLGVSESTLKSIRSSQGEVKYSKETLRRILGIVIPKG